MSTNTKDESLGSECGSSTERINSSLQKIRSELSEIRDQDLKLLKQLITISETIKALSEDRLSKRRTWYGQRQSACSELAELYLDIEPLTPDLDDYREAILVRQFSDSVSDSRDDLLDMRPKLSIFDAPLSLDSDNTMDQSWPPNFSRVPLRHRPHSVSILTSSRSYGMDNSQERTEGNDKSYEEILQRNVRLWKGRKSVHISDDDGDGARTPVNDWQYLTANINNEKDKRNSDSGSSISSVFNSSGSSYSSSAINGDSSSRNSSSSCGSCIFNSFNIGLVETMLSDVVDNSYAELIETSSANSSVDSISIAKTTENGIIVSESDVIDGPYTTEFGDRKERKESENGEQTPVVEIKEPQAAEWIRNGPLDKRYEDTKPQLRDFKMKVPDVNEIYSIVKDPERVNNITAETRSGEYPSTSGAVKVIGNEEIHTELGCIKCKGLECGDTKEGTANMEGTESEITREDKMSKEGATGGLQDGDKEKRRGSDQDVAGGEKPKRKDSGGSGGGGVVRALLDHIGRKIENRVTVGMAEYSRSFLPVISEMGKKDGRQKSSAHRPRELDIT